MAVMFGFISNWSLFFTFPHPGRSSTGVTNNINGGFIPLRCASLGAHAAHMLALWHGFLDRLRGSEALLTGVINHVCCGKKAQMNLLQHDVHAFD